MNNTTKRLTKANSTKAERRAQQQRNVNNKRRLNNQSRPRQRRNPRLKRDPYVICRLNPFASKGSLGIPDGNQVRKLVVDHRLTTTITFGSSGSVGLMIAPSLPAYVYVFTYDGSTQINGTGTPYGYGGTVIHSVPCAEWATQPISYYNTAGNYDNVGLLYSANRARIVSGAWQIMYLGTSLTDSGVVRVNTGALSVDDPIPNQANFVVPCYTNPGNTTYAISQVLVRPVNTALGTTTFTASANTYDTSIVRLSKGCHGLLKHAGKDYEYKEVLADACYLSTYAQNNQSLVTTRTLSPTTVAEGGVTQFFDNDWDTTFITITGGTNGQSFMLDTVLCVEYAPAPNSNVFALAKGGAPLNNGSLKAAEIAAGQQPVASPGAFSSIASAIDTVTTVGSVVGQIASLAL